MAEQPHPPEGARWPQAIPQPADGGGEEVRPSGAYKKERPGHPQTLPDPLPPAGISPPFQPVAMPEMEGSLEATTDKVTDLQRFIERGRQVTRLTELTPEIVHEFIDKIVVSKPNNLNGKRHQRVDIYYSTIGLWVVPEPETLEQEYMAYYQVMWKHKKKTA